MPGRHWTAKYSERKRLTPVEVDLSIPDYSIKKRKIIDLNDHTHDDIKCRVYLSANQSVGTGAWTKILLNTESYDVGKNFGAYKFIVPISKYYSVKASIAWLAPVADKQYACAIWKNGATIVDSISHASHADTVTINVVDTVYLEKDDYLELYGYQAAGSNKNASGGSKYTYMSIRGV
jgi:hypothetical protein